LNLPRLGIVDNKKAIGDENDHDQKPDNNNNNTYKKQRRHRRTTNNKTKETSPTWADATTKLAAAGYLHMLSSTTTNYSLRGIRSFSR
jgi:hypothetical protein